MQSSKTKQSRRGFSDRFAILTFVCVIASLTAASWMRYLLRPDSRIFPLLWPEDRYNDLRNYGWKMLHLERGAAFVGSGLPVFNYLAPAAFVYRFLLSATRPVTFFIAVVFGCFLILLVASAVLLVRRKLLRWEDGLGLLALAGSFPMMFVLYRANLEGIVWIAVTASLCLFLRRWYTASAIVLALAMSIKPFPVFILLLFFARKQYRAAMLSVVSAAALVICGLAALGPGLVGAYRGLQPGVLLYTQEYLRTFRSPFEQEYSHGILDALRTVYEKQVWFRSHTDPVIFTGLLTPSPFLGIYGTVALLLAAFMIFRLRRLPLLNQVLGACIALTLLPPSAADYTLCSLYLPVLLIGFFLCTEVRSGRVCWTWQHVLLLSLPLAALLSPLNVLGFWTSPSRFLLLLVLCGGTLTLPLQLPELDGATRVAADA